MLISVALDFRHASLEARERFYLSEDGEAALVANSRSARVSEVAVVTTCNRVELYGWCISDEPGDVDAAMDDLLIQWGGDGERGEELRAMACRRTGDDAALHLMRVASGLESQVLGDAQILGQVRRAYRKAVDTGSVGSALHRLFSATLHTAKRVQTETGLMAGRHSIGTEAAVVAARRHGPLAKRRCVVVGCGKTGERAARHLVRLGAVDLVLINRSPARAEQLAKETWGRAASFDSLHREIARADIAIVATSAETPVVRAGSLQFCREMAGTTRQALVMLDLSVPRNIEPEISSIAGVTLLDLDALHPPLAEVEAQLRAAVPRAEAIVEEELAGFSAWVQAEASREALRPLREALGEVCQRELSHPSNHDDIERAAGRIVAKILARPMIALRAARGRGEPVDALNNALQVLFGMPSGGAAQRSAVEAE